MEREAVEEKPAPLWLVAVNPILWLIILMAVGDRPLLPLTLIVSAVFYGSWLEQRVLAPRRAKNDPSQGDKDAGDRAPLPLDKPH